MFPIGSFGESKENMIELLGKVDISTVSAYIKRFSTIAKNEQFKFRIPASITLAFALLQSTAGQQELAIEFNNHFGFICRSDWLGETIDVSNTCYRVYRSAWSSFRDHSLYLTTGENSKLIELGKENYKGWARAIEKLNPEQEIGLGSQLIEVIEKYQLSRFDSES